METSRSLRRWQSGLYSVTVDRDQVDGVEPEHNLLATRQIVLT